MELLQLNVMRPESSLFSILLIPFDFLGFSGDSGH